MTWALAALSLTLPAAWQQVSLTQQRFDGLIPGTYVDETFAGWKHGSQDLYAFYWVPQAPRPGGPMVSVEEWPGQALGREVKVFRTSQFLGGDQEVLTTHIQLDGAQFMMYARGMSKAEFQSVLDGLAIASRK